MNPVTIPGLSEKPDFWEYFWHQLPYGFPVLVSYLISQIIAIISFLKVFSSKDKKAYIFSFAMTLQGISFYTLIQFSRINILTPELIITANKLLYFPFMLASPFTSLFVYHIAGKKGKILLSFAFLCFLAAGITFYHSAVNTLFTGEITKTSVGTFPAMIKWGKYSVMITSTAVAYSIFRLWKIKTEEKHSVSWSIFYGYVSFLLIALNALLLISGMNIFPLAVFTFVPVLCLAYGAFRADFLNLGDLLFQKNLLFYILAVLISVTFLSFAAGTAVFSKPGENFYYKNSYFLIPLFSAVITICLSAYIAGNSPENRLSMSVAVALFMNGILMITMILRSMYLPLLFEHRLGQIIFVFYAFIGAVQFRLLYIAYERPIPKFSFLVDGTALLTSVFSLSPYLYKGYYEFSFGRAGAGGPVLILFSAVNFLTLLKILFDWQIFRKEKKGILPDLIVTFAVLGSILNLSAVPSTLGFEIYPLSTLQFIPSAILAYAVIKFHALPIKGEAVQLTNRISALSALLVPIILLFYFGALRNSVDSYQITMHILFIGSFLFISIFAFTYILLRPIAKRLDEEKQKSEKLLLNILPEEIAAELKETGKADPVSFESVSVLFTDFKGFTSIAENLTPNELVKELDACFVQFDKITERYGLEKLKTIGDSYMCAAGIPKITKTDRLEFKSVHAVRACLAGLEIQNFMNMMKDLKEMMGMPYWELRLGIHSGPLVAGVIGEKKFAYDVWGDTVNTASRMESSGKAGRINISGAAFELIQDFFDCEYRGKVNAKNKGEVDMYFVNGIRKELSIDGDAKTPNSEFWKQFGTVQ